MKAAPYYLVATLLITGLTGCLTPNTYTFTRAGTSKEQMLRDHAAARVEAIKAYPDPMSIDQINSESMAAPYYRARKRDEVVRLHMYSKGYQTMPMNSAN